jgi:hypothetical protein
VAATYRFLERAGHIAGPIIVGQLWALGATSVPLVAVGIVIAVFALLFAMSRARTRAVSAA